MRDRSRSATVEPEYKSFGRKKAGLRRSRTSGKDSNDAFYFLLLHVSSFYDFSTGSEQPQNCPIYKIGRGTFNFDDQVIKPAVLASSTRFYSTSEPYQNHISHSPVLVAWQPVILLHCYEEGYLPFIINFWKLWPDYDQSTPWLEPPWPVPPVRTACLSY